MTEPDPVVERVARAIHGAMYKITWKLMSEAHHTLMREVARAAVAAMGDTSLLPGLVVPDERP